MTRDDLIDLVTREIKKLSNKLNVEDFEDSIDEALRETGWTLPATVDFQIIWLKKRTKRHLIYSLLYESASKFKFEQINSQMKFEHYEKLLDREDKAFENVKKSEPYQFANVSAYKMFGSKIDAGFAYDEAGQDLTYETDNEVVITPSNDTD